MPQASPTSSVFISDCEGPLSTNDNAFELSAHFIPKGASLFALLSKYDDVLVDVAKKPGYRAGGTLKLITPFLKAYGATDERIRDYSRRTISLVKGVREMLHYVQGIMPAFIVSTSYEQYISSLCRFIGFPVTNAYCTQLNLDNYSFSEREVEKIKAFREEIAACPMMEIPEGAQSVQELSVRDQQTIQRFNVIFEKKMSTMTAGQMLDEVQPVGGEEKAKAVCEITQQLACPLQNVIYVGDSITDVEAFRTVKDGGGVTISFNGNQYALREAEIAVLSDDAYVTALFADVFFRSGKKRVLQLVEAWSVTAIEQSPSNQKLKEQLLHLFQDEPPHVEVITPENRVKLIKESNRKRKKVRGEAIGKLG